MPTFAEQFIQGFMSGSQAKALKEKMALDAQKLALDREGQAHAMEMDERRMGLDTSRLGLETARAKLAAAESIVERRRSQSAPRIPLNEGETGPEQIDPKAYEPIEVDLGEVGLGKQKFVPEYAEDVAEQRRAADDTIAARLAERDKFREDSAMERLRVSEAGDTSRALLRERGDTERAKLKAAPPEGDPERENWLGDQVHSRNINYESLTADDKKMVNKNLADRGLNKPRKLTAQEQNTIDDAQSGYFAILKVERLLKADPSLLIKNALPGIAGRLAGASEFRAAIDEAMDVRMRGRTGAALNAEEQKFYRRNMPIAGDSPETIKFKINQLKAMYLGLSGVPVRLVSPDGRQRATVEDGFDAKQRFGMRKMIDAGWTVVE